MPKLAPLRALAMPKLAPWGGAVVAAVLASAVALACWSAEAPKSDKEALLAAAMRAYGGHQVNSVPPAWQRDGFLDAATLQHIERVLPPDEKWAACGEDPTVRCAFLSIDGEPILQDVLRRAGAMWLQCRQRLRAGGRAAGEAPAAGVARPARAHRPHPPRRHGARLHGARAPRRTDGGGCERRLLPRERPPRAVHTRAAAGLAQ